MIPAYRALSPIVRAHHLSYEVAPDAPLAARILAVVTDFVWFDRFVGRKVAVAKISLGAGTRYDPKVVQALIRLFTDEAEEATPSLI
jgi:response regulator RpfG family c-di-GMP phosphodiesterase